MQSSHRSVAYHLGLAAMLAIVAACGDDEPTGPPQPPPITTVPFSVDITVNAVPSFGCTVTWSAKASDSLVLVTYSLWIHRNRAGHIATFRHSTATTWVLSNRSVPVDWVLSAGTWSDSGGVQITDCNA